MTTTPNARGHVALPGVPDSEIIGLIPPDDLATLGILTAVPILEVTRHDERTGCRRAHRYLAGELEGIPSDYSVCHFYHGGRCDMNGRRADPCLFCEAESGRSWARVREWALLEYPDGSTAVTLASSAAKIAGVIGARVIGLEVTA